MIKFDEINVLSVMTGDRKRDREAFLDLLIDAYMDGFATANRMLKSESTIDDNALLRAIDKEYGGKRITDKMSEYAESRDEESARRLLESEMNRTFNQGELDSARKSGTKVKKVWITMQDDKVRDNHSYLEGMEIDLDAEFVTPDGDSAMAPGMFSSASNNCNCRCVLGFITKRNTD